MFYFVKRNNSFFRHLTNVNLEGVKVKEVFWNTRIIRPILFNGKICDQK